MLLRQKEIDVIIENLYEDKVSGVINEERFTKMSNRFEDESLEVKHKIKNLEKTVKEEETHELNSDKFLKITRAFNKFDTLNIQILQTFIDYITVSHHQIIDGFKVQDINICYKFVGNVSIPTMSKTNKQYMLKSFGRNSGTKKFKLAI